MTPLYVGFWTIGTAYQTEAVECLQTLDAFGLEHEFIGVPNLGDWCRNCSQKPAAIRQLMQKHDGRPLVYLDVDARVRAKPELFNRMPDEIDLGCHFRHGVELLSGTLYIGTTAGARGLLYEWCRACQAAPDVWDQRHLQTIVEAGRYNVYRLPSEYTRVFDDPKMGQPVIEHMQASRRLRCEV